MIKKKKAKKTEEVVEVPEIEVTEEELAAAEPATVEVVVEKDDTRYWIKDPNRLRLRLQENHDLTDAGFKSVEIQGADIRTVSFSNCKSVDTVFKDCNFQGCNMSNAEMEGNIFIDCDLRWGQKPSGFEQNNEFINTRLK